MTRRDQASASLLVFFIVCAFTLELYWLAHHDHLPQRSDLLARAFELYGRGDRAYYDRVSGFEIGLESFNILFTQPLNAVILFGIIGRRRWRFPLQLAVSSYVCYSTTLYLLSNHVTGYPDMPRRDAASFAIFYLANLPWVLGNAWLAWQAARKITGQSRGVESGLAREHSQ